MWTALLSFSPRSINKAAHLQLNHPPAFSLDEPVSLRSRVRGVWPHWLALGPGPQRPAGFGVHGQRVSGRQHLFLTLVLQRRDGVLLSQTHLTDQLGQILIQQLLSAFNLTNREQHTLYTYNVGWPNVQFFPGPVLVSRPVLAVFYKVMKMSWFSLFFIGTLNWPALGHYLLLNKTCCVTSEKCLCQIHKSEFVSLVIDSICNITMFYP